VWPAKDSARHFQRSFMRQGGYCEAGTDQSRAAEPLRRSQCPVRLLDGPAHRPVDKPRAAYRDLVALICQPANFHA
jgi:hypothetical protein